MTASGRAGSACVEAIPGPSQEWRRAVNSGPTDTARFQELIATNDVFSAVEVRAPSRLGPHCADMVTVAFWNAERCKYPVESAALIEAHGEAILALVEESPE